MGGFGDDGDQADLPVPKMQRFTIQTSADIISGLVLSKYLQLCTQHGITPTSYLAGYYSLVVKLFTLVKQHSSLSASS